MSVISHQAFTAALDKWGVEYVEHSRHDRCLGRTVPWHEHEARRGRDCARRSWDAHGIAVHHTGGPTSWQFVWDGRSDVPGPLYTTEIYPDGTAHLTGWRVTNNVGRCDTTVRNRVLRGDMPTSGGNVSPGGDDYAAANSEFYGIAYRGTRPNAAQRETAIRICAAICDAHGGDWDGGSIAGHKELTRRKPDPEGENMSTFRRDVNARLAAGPGGSSSGGSMDLNDNLDSDGTRRSITPMARGIIPKSWGTFPAQLLGYAAAALAWMRNGDRLSRKVWRWKGGLDYVNDTANSKDHQLARAHEYSFEALKIDRRLEQKVDTLIDLHGGEDGQAIREHIDARADAIEARITSDAQRREEIAEQAQTERGEILDLVEQVGTGDLSADEFVDAVGRRLRGDDTADDA